VRRGGIDGWARGARRRAVAVKADCRGDRKHRPRDAFDRVHDDAVAKVCMTAVACLGLLAEMLPRGVSRTTR
jgi:hypothetical protein